MATIRLYNGRDSNEMIDRIRETQGRAVATLEIRETILDADVMEAIVDLIHHNPISTVHLDDCGAYLNDQAIRLAKVLGSVENVRLSGPTFVSQNHFQAFLESGTRLSHLQIQDHLDGQLDALSKGLAANKTIQTLDVSRSRIHSLPLLAEGLRGNTSIRVLNMRSLELYDGDFQEILSALQTQVETLDLSFNHCRLTDHLGDFLKQTSLQHLSLGYQNLWKASKIDLGGLTRALRLNKTLFSLSLARNKLVDSDAFLLATAVAVNNTLESLDVRENQIADDGIVALAQAATVSKSLKQLCVIRTRYGDRGSQALFQAASENYNLCHMDANENDLLGKEIRYLAALNKGGRRLSGEDIPLGLWPLVLERVNRVNFEGDTVTDTSFDLDLVTPHQPDVLNFLLRIPSLFDSMLQPT